MHSYTNFRQNAALSLCYICRQMSSKNCPCSLSQYFHSSPFITWLLLKALMAHLNQGHKPLFLLEMSVALNIVTLSSFVNKSSKFSWYHTLGFPLFFRPPLFSLFSLLLPLLTSKCQNSSVFGRSPFSFFFPISFPCLWY